MTLNLIGSLTSPFVRKVRMTLIEKKIEYSFQMEDVWSKDTKISQFNPIGKVPCLVLDDGFLLFDSCAIVEYVDDLSPSHPLIPKDKRARAEVRMWEALADGVLEAGVTIRLENVLRAEDKRSETEIVRQWGKVHTGLAYANKTLGKHSFCHHNQFSLADISLLSCLAWFDFRFSDFAWRGQFPELAAYFKNLENRQSFVETIPQL